MTDDNSSGQSQGGGGTGGSSQSGSGSSGGSSGGAGQAGGSGSSGGNQGGSTGGKPTYTISPNLHTSELREGGGGHAGRQSVPKPPSEKR